MHGTNQNCQLREVVTVSQLSFPIPESHTMFHFYSFLFFPYRIHMVVRKDDRGHQTIYPSCDPFAQFIVPLISPILSDQTCLIHNWNSDIEDSPYTKIFLKMSNKHLLPANRHVCRGFKFFKHASNIFS